MQDKLAPPVNSADSDSRAEPVEARLRVRPFDRLRAESRTRQRAVRTSPYTLVTGRRERGCGAIPVTAETLRGELVAIRHQDRLRSGDCSLPARCCWMARQVCLPGFTTAQADWRQDRNGGGTGELDRINYAACLPRRTARRNRGICTPGMLMAATDLLARCALPQRARRWRTPSGGVLVPLHRLPPDRRGGRWIVGGRPRSTTQPREGAGDHQMPALSLSKGRADRQGQVGQHACSSARRRLARSWRAPTGSAPDEAPGRCACGCVRCAAPLRATPASRSATSRRSRRARRSWWRS